MSDPADVTMVRDAVHNPSEPRHFMRIKRPGGRLRILHGETVLADTDDAVLVLEAGRDLYDPVYYLPPASVRASLTPSQKTTHCPIKGDTTYYHLTTDSGDVVAEDLAGAYSAPVAGAEPLEGRIAFAPDRVTVEIRPA